MREDTQKFDKKEPSILVLDELFKDIGKNTGFANGNLQKIYRKRLELSSGVGSKTIKI